MNLSKHAQKRVKERCISDEAINLLYTYGEELHQKDSFFIYFSKKSIARMKAELGYNWVSRQSHLFKAFIVESAKTDLIVTAGWRYKHIYR